MRKIHTLIWHCTAAREGQEQTLAAISDFHVRVNRWLDVGYQPRLTALWHDQHGYREPITLARLGGEMPFGGAGAGEIGDEAA